MSDNLQDEDTATANWSNMHAKDGQRQAPGIPKGWPQCLESPLAWDHSTFRKEGDFICSLSDGEVVEVESALSYFKSIASY